MTVPRFETRDARGHILLVEDASVLREIQALLLRSSGYDVATCSEPAQALAQVDCHRFDVVVLNSDNPAAYGREFIAALRHGEKPPALVALIWNMTPESADELKRHGASAVLDRPLNPAVLLQQIDLVLGLEIQPSAPKHYSQLSAINACAADWRTVPSSAGSSAPFAAGDNRRDSRSDGSPSALSSSRTNSFGGLTSISSGSYSSSPFGM